MGTFNGTIQFPTKKNDGFKGDDGSWYNAPYGTKLVAGMTKGASVSFEYSEKNAGGRVYKNIDLSTVKINSAGSAAAPATGNSGGGYSGGGTPQQLQIVRQSSLNRAVDYASTVMDLQFKESESNKGKGKSSLTMITPVQIMQLADQFQQWVVGDLTLPKIGDGTGAEAPKTEIPDTAAAGGPGEDDRPF